MHELRRYMDAVQALVETQTLYTGWLLPAAERVRLLQIIPAAYPRVIAHHITLQYGVPADSDLPTATSGDIVGIADDGMGVQALIVRIGGNTRRDDGGVYHITWSLAEGRQPVESNAVILEHGWRSIASIMVTLEPKLFG